jgi:hypothetical protein
MTCAFTDQPEPQSLEALLEVLPHILRAPKIDGTLELIVRRPQVDAREVLAEGELNTEEGLAGDSWRRLSVPARLMARHIRTCSSIS